MNALWWWIDRWRKSSAYTDMTLEEQGAYRNLLDEATLRGGAIPNNDRTLAQASGDMLAWKKVKKAVLARFYLAEDGWRNETLDAVLAQSRYRAEKQKRYRQGKNGPTIRAIVARDGSICGICANAVDAMAAEIDHIIPVSRGGHVEDVRNLQLAHAGCNYKKGTRSCARHESLIRLTAGLLQSNAQSNTQNTSGNDRSSGSPNGLRSPDPYPDQEQEIPPVVPPAGGTVRARRRRIPKHVQAAMPSERELDAQSKAVQQALDAARAREARVQ